MRTYPRSGFRSGVSSTAKLRIWTLRIWGFRGPGFRSARQVLCGDASRLFLAHFSKHLSSVSGRTELCHEVRIPGPQKPQIIRNENHHLALFGTSECALVLVFVPGEHPPNPPFWKTTLFQPPIQNSSVSVHNVSGTQVCTGDFAPPEPEFRAGFWDTNPGHPNFGHPNSNFLILFFSTKKAPLKNSPSRNS